MNVSKCIQELNIIFKQRGWELISENNSPPDDFWFTSWIYNGDKGDKGDNELVVERTCIPYDLYCPRYRSKTTVFRQS